MGVIETIRDKAKAKHRRVVLPEGTEPRMIDAAKILVEEAIADVTLIGDQAEIKKLAASAGLDLNQVEVVNPAESPDLDDFVTDFVELRKKKNVTEEAARKAIIQPLYFGAMLVRHDKADASVAGSINTTGNVLRAAIHVLGLKKGISAVSSSFLMTIPEYRGVKDKVFAFGDCAVIPNPNPEQLASIAMSTAETMNFLTGEEPRVAMLSFSTKGSAKHEDADKVLAAMEIIKKEQPSLLIDGEFQLDAAIVPEVGKRKAPDSAIAGDANVLIFPDLDAGNIGYKLVQRLANATATGPIIQGLAKPANDLSRGCSVQDIVDVSALATLLRG
ncbi:MAG: phosphate acetyltransferase [candidate division Zixibacteria bacterium]|nr:phosphate acetyltransferase [candidate division Zixibacteria bacterium]